MRIEPQAASRLEAIPVALIAQSVTVLAQNAESLRRTIDAFVLGNPLLEYAPAGANPAEALDITELAVARRTTLAEHLGMQLRIAERDLEVLRIGRMIIESLDKYGYLREHTEDMLRASHASPAAFARALAAVQALEPCGVAEINDLCEDFEEMRIRLKENDTEAVSRLRAGFNVECKVKY